MKEHEPLKAPVEPSLGSSAPPLEPSVDERVGTEFSAFYRSEVTLLVGFLRWLGASPASAADTAQETMIDAFRAWPQIDHPAAWVRKVASRELARHQYGPEPIDPLPEHCALVAHTDALAEWESKQEMELLLQQLPPRQRQVLAWSVTGFTPAQIAVALSISGDAVRANLKKARAAIARQLTNGRQHT